MNYTFAAVIVKEDKSYVAHCLEPGVTSQGLTLEEGPGSFREAAFLFLYLVPGTA